MKQRWRINKRSAEKQRTRTKNDREDINPYPMTERGREGGRNADAIKTRERERERAADLQSERKKTRKQSRIKLNITLLPSVSKE